MHRAGDPIAHSRHVAQRRRPRLHALRSSIAIAVAALEGVLPAQARSAFVCMCVCVCVHEPPPDPFAFTLFSFSSQEPATKGSRMADDKRRKRTLRRSKTTHSNGSVLCTSTRSAVQPHGERTRTRHREKSDGRESEENERGECRRRSPKASLFLSSSPQRTCVWRGCNVIVCGGTARPSAKPSSCPYRG